MMMGSGQNNMEYQMDSKNPYQNMSTMRVRPQKSLGPSRLMSNKKSHLMSYSNIGLTPCKGCNKTFTLEQLPIHMKVCKEEIVEN